MLKINNLHAAYGGIKALKGVSLEVNEGEVVAVLGSNGAGKSTLLNCISSVVKPTEGSIEFLGNLVPKHDYDVVGTGLVHVPEGRQIFTHLTVRDNLLVGAYLRNDPKGIKEDLDRVHKLFPRLKERENQYGGHLSGGEQQMLAISRGIMARPKLMLLDEPSLGLAPIIVNQIFEIIKEINKAGTAIMIVEQNAFKALSICDRAYILNVGLIEKTGTREEILCDDSLSKAYLGE
ncbi:MAG: ABC transporter ATP-binding protein [Spirochaetales bacterium]|nr:ABC transporter ATP-binding protein [Spirochaetales bacterium]